MADNVAITAGTGTTIATDDVGGVHYQRIKPDLGGDGASAPLIDQAVPTVLLPVGGKIVRVSQTPTVSTSAYAAKDCMGGLLTFANAARASGGGITIEGGVVTDLAATMPSLDLLLFDQTFSAGTDNAALDVSDTDILNLIGVIPFTSWADFADNSAATRFGLGLSAKLAGTSLFGQLVTRSIVTLAGTSDITVILHIRQH